MRAIKPDEKFIRIISHIEEKYSCSGFCTPPLFYFTQSVTKGPPRNACLLPLINDMGLILQNLGASLIVTGILFFFMIFCAFPVCCYNKEKDFTEEDQDRSAAYKS